jgi:hypothetical protein
VLTARYGLNPYITQIRYFFKRLIKTRISVSRTLSNLLLCSGISGANIVMNMKVCSAELVLRFCFKDLLHRKYARHVQGQVTNCSLITKWQGYSQNTTTFISYVLLDHIAVNNYMFRPSSGCTTFCYKAKLYNMQYCILYWLYPRHFVIFVQHNGDVSPQNCSINQPE